MGGPDRRQKRKLGVLVRLPYSDYYPKEIKERKIWFGSQCPRLESILLQRTADTVVWEETEQKMPC